MKLEGIPVRILEEKIYFLEREIYEQQIYGNWLLFLVDGVKRQNPSPPIKTFDERNKESLEKVLDTALEKPEPETLGKVLENSLVKIPEFDPFVVISELSSLLSEFLSSNNILTLWLSEQPKPSWYKSFREWNSQMPPVPLSSTPAKKIQK